MCVICEQAGGISRGQCAGAGGPELPAPASAIDSSVADWREHLGVAVRMNVCYCSRHTSALRNSTKQARPYSEAEPPPSLQPALPGHMPEASADRTEAAASNLLPNISH